MGPTNVPDFSDLLDESLDLICRIDTNMHFVDVSSTSQEVLGWTPNEMLGKRLSDFVLHDDIPALAASLTLTFFADLKFTPLTVGMHRKDESIVNIEVRSRVRQRSVDSGPDILLILRDVTMRTQMENQLYALALEDGLTELANRRAFDIALDRDLKRSLRDRTPLTLILLDLDFFKQFNDHLGHTVGDDCLRAIATAIQSCIHRATDTAARYGGEEFAMVLPHTDTAGALLVAETMRTAILNLGIPHPRNPCDGRVTASFGVITFTPDPTGPTLQTSRGLLVAADDALYQAKHQGRNCIVAARLPHDPATNGASVFDS